MSHVSITIPLSDEVVDELRIGQRAFISGIMYAGRAAAHKKIMESLRKGKKLPFELKGQVIFYAEFSPAKSGQVIGSMGPADSEPMDVYTPILLSLGLKGMIGKGKRSTEVVKAMQKNKAVYFAALGGAAALIGRCVKSSKVIAYPELGPEAFHEVMVENFPVIVVNDILGRDLYEEGVKIYANKKLKVSGKAGKGKNSITGTEEFD